jgi:predicted phage-related endonuclease
VSDFETVRRAILAEWEGTHGVIGEGKDILAALDRIEAEVERLRAESEQIKATIDGQRHEYAVAWQALRESRAEVERLREALERIELQTTQDWIRNIARNALAEEVTPIHTDP